MSVSNHKTTAPFVEKGIDYSLAVPGSKSITQRALVTAALAQGVSVLRGPLESDDTLLLAKALSDLGMSVEKEGDDWMVSGTGGHVAPCPFPIYMGNNGTGIRFMTAVAALGSGEYKLTGARRMEERPIAPLLEGLSYWGVKAWCENGNDCPPVIVRGGGISGGEAELDTSKSSQFLSAMLLIAPLARSAASIRLSSALVSRPYVDITIAVMREFGIDVKEEGGIFRVPQGAYRPTTYPIEGDASSASYFWAAAAVTGGRVTVTNIGPRPLQGDAHFSAILEEMGCTVEKGPGGVTVQGPPRGELKGIEINMAQWPDVVPTLAVTAAFAQGETVITNVPHLRIKETDRLSAVATELKKLGADVEEMADGLRIKGGRRLHRASISTYEDHRIAMSFAVAGLRVEGVEIEDPECVNKSFPKFWKRWFEMTQG